MSGIRNLISTLKVQIKIIAKYERRKISYIPHFLIRMRNPNREKKEIVENNNILIAEE